MIRVRNLKQGYADDIEPFLVRGDKLDVMVCIEEPLYIAMMLAHIQRQEKLSLSQARASHSCSKAATVSRHLPIGNFYASAKVKHDSVTIISMSSRLCDR